MLAVDDAGAWADSDAQTLVADGHTPVGTDLERGARAPNVRPPRAAGRWTQDAALLALGGFERRVGRAAQFAVNFVSVAVAAQFGQERVGVFGCRDGFGGKEGGQAALPVLVLAFDFALSLRRARVAQGDAVEVERRSELREGLGMLRKEQAVAIHIEFQGQAVFAEGGGKEIEISQEVFAVIDFGAGADAGAIIEQVEQGIIFLVRRKPAVRRGVQLPERAGLEALPAAQ